MTSQSLISKAKIDLVINIARKDKGITDKFTRTYTMQEHYENLPVKDGRIFAINKYGKEEIVIQINPIDDVLLESELIKQLQLEDLLLISKIHNPMHFIFCGYQKRTIMGIDLLLRETSYGACYAVCNKAWSAEYEANELYQAKLKELTFAKGLDTYNVLFANGNTQTLTRNCLFNNYIMNDQNKASVINFDKCINLCDKQI
jgi:hypothetical protein